MPHTIARHLRRGALLVALAVAHRSGAQSPASAPNAADVRFMQGMIHHHAQAIEMAALVPTRTTRDDMRLVAERIDVSQRDEIATMQRWLGERHQAVPRLEPHAMGDMHDMATMKDMPGMTADSTTTMPGMASPAQMDSLRAATGTTFDRLFLTYMIRHHEGALTMVAQLFKSTGAAQDPTVFQFASDVDVDQRAEIARMRALLAALAPR